MWEVPAVECKLGVAFAVGRVCEFEMIVIRSVQIFCLSFLFDLQRHVCFFY